MKSSMTTNSRLSPLSVTPAPRMVLPLVMRTRLMTDVGNETPRNSNVWLLPPTAGTKNLPNDALAELKYSIDELLVRSTSEKIAPKPFVVVGVLKPGMKKLTSVIVEPRAVNNRWAVKG